MRFAVLGPLTVTDDRGTLPVNGEKQRLLLAILLSRVGQPVSVDALVDALWGDRACDVPHKRLSWHVHRLRGSLGDVERIVRNDNGYALSTEHSELDVDEFVRRCRTAEKVKATGGLAAAGEQWAAALRLWRGAPYGDLGEHRLLRAEATRLAGLRLRALEQRIGVDLDLGRHDELAEELTALVSQHPVRERFRGQLMLALYRAGRRSEALDAYRDARETLVEQLGVEPGRELSDLHRDMLRDAPGLAVAAPASPVRRPAELPAGSAAFTGRDADLDRLRDLLGAEPSGPMAIATVTGAGGIGKSALAIRAARAVAGRFPDGQLYLNLRGATPEVPRLKPADALRRMLRSLDVEIPVTVTDTDELAARFRSAVADRRLLLLLDDAADVEQVVPLLPGSPGCAVVVTSRDPLSQLDGATCLRLDALRLDDAKRLLTRLTGREETAATAELAELCDRMPLAVCIVAARLNTDPRSCVDRLAEQLRSQARRLGQLDDGRRAVRSTFMLSYTGLDAEAAGMFRRLGLHHGDDISLVNAAALAAIPSERARAALARLVTAHLVEETESGRYAMHDLLRLFSQERADADEPESERREAIERVLHAYLASARNALRVCDREAQVRCDLEPRELTHPGEPIDDLTAAYGWGTDELANLAPIVAQAAHGGHPHIAVAIAVATLPTLYYQGFWRQVHELCRIAAPAAESFGSLSHRSHIYRELATVEASLNLLDDGLEHATGYLETCVELGDEAGQARALSLQGTMLRKLDRLDEATHCLRRSLSMCAKTASPRLETLVWIKFGLIHAQAHRTDEAADAFERGAALAERHGDDRNQVAAIGNLAYLRRECGDTPAAVATFGTALSIIRRTTLAGTVSEADTLWGLGDSLHDLGRAPEARRHWDDSAEILVRVGLITDAERQAIAASDRPEMPRVLR